MNNFSDIFKKSFISQFSMVDISLRYVVMALGLCCLFAAYIFIVYRFVTRKTFYDKSTSISIALSSVVVCSIIITIQSNLVVSLGMVGALSIIRFRTAIKNPLDLVFMFWSIAVGIICGAGMPVIAAILSFALTGGIVIFNMIPIATAPMLLVVNATTFDARDAVLEEVKKNTAFYTVKSQVSEENRLSMILEVRLKKEANLVQAVSSVENVTRAALLSHDGEVTF